MDEKLQFTLPKVNFDRWRLIALGACLLAMFWPVIVATVTWAGSNALQTYGSPYPSVWVAAFIFGVLIARMQALYVAAAGVVAAVAVSIGLHAHQAGKSPDQLFSGDLTGAAAKVATLIVQLAVPWIWVAVFIGVGVLARERFGTLLGLRD